MATRLLSSIASRRFLAGATALSATSVAFYTYSPRHQLDSVNNAPTQTLTFPSTMLFSKQLSVTAVEQINHDTKRITFALPGGQQEISGVPAGSAILTQHTPAGGWFPVFRPYTPVHDRDERGTLQLLVKQYPNGKASTHLHSLSPGQTLTVRGPLPGYTWTPSASPRSVLFLAGGAGITPVYSLTKGILSNEADKTRINIVWGVNGLRDIVLREELEQLEAQHPDRLRVIYAVSGLDAQSNTTNSLDRDKYKNGHIDTRILQDAVQWCGKGSFGDETGKKVFLSGPPAMEEAIASKKGILSELGIEKKAIHIF